MDYLEDDIDSYSIDQTPINPIVKQYSDGGKIKQIAFDFTVTEPISSQAIVNLANSKFCEDFSNWIEKQNKARNLPQIEGIQSIKCTSPRLHIAKNRRNGNLYYSNELPILRSLLGFISIKEDF